MVIRVIDMMAFDSGGKILDMKAYHGPGDVITGLRMHPISPIDATLDRGRQNIGSA